MLKNRIIKLEAKYLPNKNPDAFAMAWWDLHQKMNPELILPEQPPADWVNFYNGKTIDDLLKEYQEVTAHGN